MLVHPSHLDDCAEDASARFPDDASDVHKHVQVVCLCGCCKFRLLQSNRESVVAVCPECGQNIVVYDLALYPAAVKLPGTELFCEMESMPIRPASVFVRYEYSEPEPDVEFDRNDITWCQIFSENEAGDLVKIFDDETA
jgi:predicted RNA-binding Zn-ribbon protein involved in translation (DUF1610 family)